MPSVRDRRWESDNFCCLTGVNLSIGEIDSVERVSEWKFYTQLRILKLL